MFEKLMLEKEEKIKEISANLKGLRKISKCSTMVGQNWTKSYPMVKVPEIEMDWASKVSILTQKPFLLSLIPCLVRLLLCSFQKKENFVFGSIVTKDTAESIGIEQKLGICSSNCRFIAKPYLGNGVSDAMKGKSDGQLAKIRTTTKSIATAHSCSFKKSISTDLKLVAQYHRLTKPVTIGHQLAIHLHFFSTGSFKKFVPVCHFCGVKGHIRPRCFNMRKFLENFYLRRSFMGSRPKKTLRPKIDLGNKTIKIWIKKI